MTHPLLSAVLAEPAVADPPGRTRRDWWLLAGLVGLVTLEGVLGEQAEWRAVAVCLGVALAVTTLWRRSHPLAMTVTAFASVMVLDQSLRLATGEPLEHYSLALLLIHPYALFRWGSGRHCVIGAAVLVVALVVGFATDWTGVGDAIGGAIVLAVPAVAGVEVRRFVDVRERRIEQVRDSERALLARDLHDTVAHHVSAIAVRAQAGQVVGATDPGASLDALAVIETEASRTLAEMRNIVGALRGQERADFAPQPDVVDVERLADPDGSPPVKVSVNQGGREVGGAVASALFRIAQEGVTNARRHARQATEIEVRLDLDGDVASLVVVDDGVAIASDAPQTHGFGLIGMAERVALLGGHMDAGPVRPKGWRIAASIPLRGSRSCSE